MPGHRPHKHYKHWSSKLRETRHDVTGHKDAFLQPLTHDESSLNQTALRVLLKHTQGTLQRVNLTCISHRLLSLPSHIQRTFLLRSQAL